MYLPSSLLDLTILCVCALSPAIGSFALLVSDRLARQEPWIAGRSRCDHCGRRLRVSELVPVFSWILQKGKSRCCDRPLRSSLWLVESASLVVALWAVAATDGAVTPISIALGWVLIVLALVDFRTYRLPDALTLPLVLMGLGLCILGLTGDLLEHSLAAVLGYAAFWAIGRAYFSLRNVTGLGLGDAKFLAGIGAWTGLSGLLSALLIACFLALLQACMTQRSMTRQTSVPFGPALCAGFWVTWLHGPLVMSAA